MKTRTRLTNAAWTSRQFQTLLKVKRRLRSLMFRFKMRKVKLFPPDFRVKPAVLLSPPLRPPAPPCLACPAHEHLGLEWDPSVDIGRSVSHDDADSSYFSTDTGRK